MIFNIALTEEQINVLAQGLDELKFKVAAPVAQAIQAQINAQLVAQAAQEKARAEAEQAAKAPPPPVVADEAQLEAAPVREVEEANEAPAPI